MVVEKESIMVALANELEEFVRSSSLSTERHVEDNRITICIKGRHGTAEIEFSDDGEIIAMIDADVIHGWHPLPNTTDMRSSARKIRELIG